MNLPTKPGYYWVKVPGYKWVLACVFLEWSLRWRYINGNDLQSFDLDIGEWSEEILPPA